MPAKTLQRVMASPAKLFSVLFGCLLVTNLPYLLAPPYWDAVVGVYAQGIWLKAHHYDFAELMRQPSYRAGGPNVNILYAAAPVVGGLLAEVPRDLAFFLLHVTTLVLAALTGTIWGVLLMEIVPAGVAACWVAAGMLEPAWSGQTAAIYLEVPLVCAVSMSLLLTQRSRFVAAAAVLMGAFFIKQSALLLALCLWVWLAVLRVFRIPGGPPLGAAWPLLVPAPLMLLLGRLSSERMDADTEVFDRVRHALNVMWFDTPMVTVLSGVVILVLMVGVARHRMNLLDARHPRPLMLLLVLLLCAFWAGFVLHPYPLPRYITLIGFPLVALGAFITAPRKRAWLVPALVTAVHIINQNGALFPTLPSTHARSGEMLERSREWLEDQEGQLAVCKEIQKLDGIPVVAKYPFVQMLTLPELGCVDRAVAHVFAAGRVPTYTSANSFAALPPNVPVAVVYSPNAFEFSFHPSLQPRPTDILIAEDISNGAPLVLYLRRDGFPQAATEGQQGLFSE
jgi:hypothetical protein